MVKILLKKLQIHLKFCIFIRKDPQVPKPVRIIYHLVILFFKEQLPGAFGDISDFLEEKKSSGEVISVIDIMKKNLPGMHILPDLLMMHKLEEFVKSEDSNDVFDMYSCLIIFQLFLGFYLNA